MPIKDLHKDKDFRDSTKTKLDIFENYLTEWLPTFLFSEPEVTICDFFAGPGTDVVGNPGSPIRIFNVIQKYEEHIWEKNVRINVILNEQHKEKFKTLQEKVGNRLKEMCSHLRELISVRFFNEDFQDVFPALEAGLKDGPNLFFFDQNGVKHVTVDFIKHLETFNKTDYLFFLSSGYFKRFEFENLFPELNIKKENIKYSEIHRTIVEKLRAALPEDSQTKLYHFSIKKGGNIYGLVFGATHLLGVEKFLKVAWNKNKINGEANFDIDHDLDTQKDLFTDETPKATKLQRFEIELIAFARERKRFTNKDVFIYTLNKGFTP